MPELGYWDIRGLAQPIRMLLHYCGEEFEDKRYTCGEGPEFSRECWLEKKGTLGLDFPNLPYYIDGDIKVSQTNAILRYIARKHNMCGTTEHEKILVDITANQVMDFRNGFVQLVYSQRHDDVKGLYLKNIPDKLKLFENFLSNKTWLAGKDLTFPDFHLYEMLDQHKMYAPGCLKDFPVLTAYCKRFEELPGIKKFMASKMYMKSPVNNPMAKWVG